MNTGMKTIEWLFIEQLRVDDKWSAGSAERLWIVGARKNEQTVEVVGEENQARRRDWLFRLRSNRDVGFSSLG